LLEWSYGSRLPHGLCRRFRPSALPVLALTVDTSLAIAFSNDYGFGLSESAASNKSKPLQGEIGGKYIAKPFLILPVSTSNAKNPL